MYTRILKSKYYRLNDVKQTSILCIKYIIITLFKCIINIHHFTMNVGQLVKEQALRKLTELNLNKNNKRENINQALSSARMNSCFKDIG